MSAYLIESEIKFTHNAGVTIADIEKRLRALSSGINIPLNFGGGPGKGGSGSGSRGGTDFTKGYSKATSEFKKLRATINDVETEIGKLGFQAALTAKRFLAFVGVSGIFIGLVNSIRSGVGAAVQYEKQFAKISQVTGVSIKNLGELDREVTRLSKTLGVGSDKISDIALTLAQAGLTAKDTTRALDVLAKTELSATFGDIKNTTEGAIAIMAQFKTGAADLEGQLSSVNTVAARFAVESEDLVEVIRKAGGAFKASGGELNQLLALFTSVRATTRESAESISTGLRTIFTRLQRGRTINFLSQLGVDLRDAKGEFIGIYPAVEKLSKALEDISGTDPRFNQIVEELGGFRQVSKVIPLLKQFETSQKALSVARRAGDSIDRDAAIAQKTLANQASRVKEEFLALSRAYLNDDGIKFMISQTLNLASALIKVADALRPLIPLIGVIGTLYLRDAVAPFIGGIKSQHAGPLVKKPLHRAGGGPVPGSGNGDTVPAMLEPGEFVIKKSAAKAFGQENLHKINKYGFGGIGKRFGKFITRQEYKLREKSPLLNSLFGPITQKVDDGSAALIASLKAGIRNPIKSISSGLRGIGGFASNLGADSLSRVGGGLKRAGLGIQDFLGISRKNPWLGDPGYGLGSTIGVPSGISKNKIILNESRKILKDLQKELGTKFDKNLVSKLIVTSDIGKFTNNNKAKSARGYFTPDDNKIVLNSMLINDKKNLKKTLLHELGHAVDYQYGKKLGGEGYASQQEGNLANELAYRGYKRLESKDRRRNISFSQSYTRYRYSEKERFADTFRDYALNKKYRQVLNKLGFHNIVNDVSVGKYASGGHVGGIGNGDTVPSLLTPGEFVINKKSAQAFGYGNLAKVNKYASGGKVQQAAIGAAVLGPSLLQGAVGDNKELQNLTSAITTATGAILAFSFLIKKDTEEFGHSLTLKKEELDLNKKNFVQNSKELNQKFKNRRVQFLGDTDSLRERIKIGTIPLIGGGSVTSKDADRAQQKLNVLTQNYDKDIQKGRKQNSIISLARQKDKDRITKEIAQIETTQKLTDNFNIFAERVSYASAVMIGFGASLQGANSDLANKGKRGGVLGFGTIAESAAGGALTGAGTGALSGAFVGGQFGAPGVGALIGGIGGGLIGGVTGGTGARAALNSFDIKDSFDKLEQTLSNISKGRSTVADVKGKVNASLRGIDENFFKLAGDQFDTFKGSISNNIDGLELVFNESLKVATSFKDFTEENKDLINVLTRFGGFTVPELEKKIEDEIKSRNKFLKANDEFTNTVLDNARRLEATFAITTALDDAENSVHDFGNSLDRLAQIANGSFSSAKTNFNFSSLNNIATANSGNLKQQANQAAGFIGGSAKGITGDIVQAGELSRKLPSILNDLVLRNQLEGDDLIDELKKQLGGGFAANTIVEGVKKEIGDTGDTTKFLEKFKQNPIEITKNIQASLQPLAESLANAAPRIIQQFNDFADGLSSARENFLASLGGLTKSIDIIQTGREFNLASTGRPLSFAEGRGFDVSRQNLVTGGASADQLAKRLGVAQGNITSLSSLRQNSKNTDEVKKLTQAIDDNIKEVQVTTRALDFLSDVNSRLATVEKERSRLQQIRENKTNLAKDFAFGDSDAKQNIVKGLIGVKTILQNLEIGKSPLGGLNNQLKQSSLGVLEQFGDADVFNGKTGKEIINEILKSQGFPVGVNKEEQNVIDQGNIIIQEARAAQELLNSNVADNNQVFLKGLGEKFDTFFANLEQSFKAEKAEKDKQVNEDINARIGGIQGQIEAITAAKAKVGLGVGSPLSLLQNNADIGININKNDEEIFAASQELGRIRGFRNNNDTIVDTKNIRKFIGGEEGNVLEQDLNRIKNNGGSIASINDTISDTVQIAFDKLTTKKSEENKSLFEQLGVDDAIKDSFIRGAKEAVEILKKAEVTEDIPKLQQRQKELRGTLRANGGPVGRGTDTVPAMTTDGHPYMLTPGEIVMNRKASGKFGGLLHRMNMGYMADGGIVKDGGRAAMIAIQNANKNENMRINFELNKALALNKKSKEESAIKEKIRREEDKEYKKMREQKILQRGLTGIRRETLSKNPSSSVFPSQVDTIGKMFENRIKRPELRQADVNPSQKRFTQNPWLALGVNPAAVAKIQQGQAAQGQQVINPKLMEDFNKVVEKLGGAKLELQITGTVNVNINASNLADNLNDKFKPVIQEYVDNEISKAITKFANANGIQHIPAAGKKEGKR